MNHNFLAISLVATAVFAALTLNPFALIVSISAMTYLSWYKNQKGNT